MLALHPKPVWIVAAIAVALACSLDFMGEETAQPLLIMLAVTMLADHSGCRPGISYRKLKP